MKLWAFFYYNYFELLQFYLCCILAQNKENCWNDLVTCLNFAKKIPIYINWNFMYFSKKDYALNQASFNLLLLASVAFRPAISS